jgi:hypothetical protein
VARLRTFAPHEAAVIPIAENSSEVRKLMKVLPRGDPLPGTDDELVTAIHHRYAGTWRTLARKLEAAGKRAEAAWAGAATLGSFVYTTLPGIEIASAALASSLLAAVSPHAHRFRAYVGSTQLLPSPFDVCADAR